MSIVLVIIGLIIGGILVGRDLIKASETRAQISQIEKYNTAVNTFKINTAVFRAILQPSSPISLVLPWGQAATLPYWEHVMAMVCWMAISRPGYTPRRWVKPDYSGRI
jgi:hypothetical protein